MSDRQRRGHRKCPSLCAGAARPPAACPAGRPAHHRRCVGPREPARVLQLRRHPRRPAHVDALSGGEGARMHAEHQLAVVAAAARPRLARHQPRTRPIHADRSLLECLAHLRTGAIEGDGSGMGTGGGTPTRAVSTTTRVQARGHHGACEGMGAPPHTLHSRRARQSRRCTCTFRVGRRPGGRGGNARHRPTPLE